MDWAREGPLHPKVFKQSYVSGSLLRQRVALRFQFIEAEKANYPVTVLCRVLEVSRSGFYA